jgi:citrate lyase alpha subunit
VASTFPKSAELIETIDSTLDIWTGTTTSTTDAYIDAHDGLLCANVAVQSTYFALGATSADTTPTGGATLTFTDALQTQTASPAVFAVPALARYLSLWR